MTFVKEEGTVTAERPPRGELVTAAIDVTKAVSKFMGTVLSVSINIIESKSNHGYKNINYMDFVFF